jgi:transposase
VGEKELVTNIRRRLKNVYEDNAVDKNTVSRWASRIAGFEKGQAELSKTPRSGRPTTTVTPELLQLADKLIRKDRRITTRRLATELSESKGTVNNIIDALGYSKACARWVPRSLTDDQRTVRKELCSDLFSR